MTEKTPATLDRLWDDIPTGTPPIGDLLTAGHTLNRRKRNTRALGVAAATALIIGGVGTQQALTSTSNDQNNNLAADAGSSTYSIEVNTTRVGPQVYYIEGAVEEVYLTHREDGDRSVALTPSVHGDTAPGRYAWDDLAAGEYTIEGAVRPCSGSCDELDPPTDSCQQNLTLSGDTEVLLTFRYGQPCTITNPANDEPAMRVQPQVGHCYVEPMTFAGQRWGVRFSEQFGGGGPQYFPENWQGSGVLTRVSEDRVLYTDDGGAKLILLPAESPAVARAEDVICW